MIIVLKESENLDVSGGNGTCTCNFGMQIWNAMLTSEEECKQACCVERAGVEYKFCAPYTGCSGNAEYIKCPPCQPKSGSGSGEGLITGVAIGVVGTLLFGVARSKNCIIS